jgi:hypothetical protein
MTEKLIFDDLGFYQQTIVTDTNCALEDAWKVEDIMRNFTLHSTLDWLSRAQFRREAHKAYKILQHEGGDMQEYFDHLQRHGEDVRRAIAEKQS